MELVYGKQIHFKNKKYSNNNKNLKLKRKEQ